MQDHRGGGTAALEDAARAWRRSRKPGVPGFSTGAWWGVFGPANLPRPVVDKIRAEIARLLGTPEMQKIFDGQDDGTRAT